MAQVGAGLVCQGHHTVTPANTADTAAHPTETQVATSTLAPMHSSSLKEAVMTHTTATTTTTGKGGDGMSESNCEPALLSSLEALQHNLQDAGMLRMKASLYSEAAVREALGDSEYRRISEKLDRRALLAQLDAVSLFLLQVLGLVSVGEGDGDLLSAEADVMNGAGEFPHLFAFCMIPEPSGATGSDTEIVERFVKRLSLCLH